MTIKTYPLWFKRLVYRLARHIQRCDEHRNRSEGCKKAWITRKALKGSL